MSILAADTPASEISPSRATAVLSSLAVALWIAAGMLSASSLSALETANAGGILAALILSLLVLRRPTTMAERPGARLWTVAIFIFSLLTLSPAFQRFTSAHDFREWSRLIQLSAF